MLSYFIWNTTFGGDTFYSVNIDDKQIETPTIDWINSNQNSGFFVLRHIEKTSGSGFYSDLWLLGRDLTEGDLIELMYTQD